MAKSWWQRLELYMLFAIMLPTAVSFPLPFRREGVISWDAGPPSSFY